MSFSIEPIYQSVEDRGLVPPDGRDFWTDPQCPGERPSFSTGMTAEIFFARSRSWLQRRLGWGRHVLNGELIEIPIIDRCRRFQLHHVELVAHAFLTQGLISLDTFGNCITIVKAMSKNYRLFEGSIK